MIVKVALIVSILILFPPTLLAKREHPVKWCQAQKGRVEVVLPDGTRCDCVTDTHAIEFDFGGT